MSRVARRKKRRRKSGNPIYLIFAIALILVAASAYLYFTDTYGLNSSVRGLLTASQLELVDEDGLRIFEGEYVIDEAGVIFENIHIQGNLYLGPGIGDGSIELNNIIVDGVVFVQGGGLSTLNITDCRIPELRVNRPEGRIRLVAKGETSVDLAILETGVRLVENLSGDADGFNKIEVMTSDKVELAGAFESIRLSVKDSFVEIESEELEELVITRTAAGSAIKAPDGMALSNFYIDGNVYVIGQLNVEEAYLSAPGLTELAGSFNLFRITAEAGQLKLLEGSTFSEMVIAVDSLNNELTLEPDVMIASLELNEAAEIKGEGQIELVTVNAPGSTMEQIPLDLVLGDDISITIAGYEISSSDMLRANLPDT